MIASLRFLTIVLVVVAVASPGCVQGTRPTAVPPATQAQDDDAIQRAMQTRLPEVRCTNGLLVTCLDSLLDQQRFNFAVNWVAMDKIGIHWWEKTITVDLHDVTWETALKKVLAAAAKQGAVDFQIEDGVLRVSTPRDLAAAPVRPLAPDDSPATRRMLNRMQHNIPEFRSGGMMTVRNAIEYVRDLGKVNVHVNWPIVEGAGVRANDHDWRLRLIGTTLDTTLREILMASGGREAGVTYAVRDGVIKISTPADLAAIPSPQPEPRGASTQDRRVFVKLDADVPETRFAFIPLESALTFLADREGVRIAADWEALGKVGIRKDTEITLRLMNVTLATTLREVLSDAAGREGTLGFVVRDGEIKIVTLNGQRPTQGRNRPARPGAW